MMSLFLFLYLLKDNLIGLFSLLGLISVFCGLKKKKSPIVAFFIIGDCWCGEVLGTNCSPCSLPCVSHVLLYYGLLVLISQSWPSGLKRGPQKFESLNDFSEKK